MAGGGNRAYVSVDTVPPIQNTKSKKRANVN